MSTPASQRAPKSVPPKSVAPPAPSARASLVLVNGRQPLPPPFPFQARAARNAKKLLAQGINTVVVSPTGSGKTNIAGYTLDEIPNDEILSISHSNALRDQLEERLCQSVTVQALLAGWRPEKKPRVVVWDECHHSAADMWGTAREIFPKAGLLGLTPCPQRADGRALGLFDEMIVAAHYSELMNDGVIVPCKVSGPSEGISDAKRPDPVKAYLEYGEEKKAIFFLPDIPSVEDVTKRLKRQKIEVGSYHSEMPKGARKDMFKQFSSGEIQIICAVYALSEGIDVPDAEVCILDQQCTGLSQYMNSVGRVLRAAHGKKFAHVIDLRGASLRHGHPCADRDYSLWGAGVKLKQDLEHTPREYTGREELPLYGSKIVTWYDWKWPTPDDRRRQLGWLKRQAATQGLTEEFAERAMRMLFDNEKAGAA